MNPTSIIYKIIISFFWIVVLLGLMRAATTMITGWEGPFWNLLASFWLCLLTMVLAILTNEIFPLKQRLPAFYKTISNPDNLLWYFDKMGIKGFLKQINNLSWGVGPKDDPVKTELDSRMDRAMEWEAIHITALIFIDLLTIGALVLWNWWLVVFLIGLNLILNGYPILAHRYVRWRIETYLDYFNYVNHESK